MGKASNNIADKSLAESVKHNLLSYISESGDARKSIVAAYLFGSARRPEKFKKNSDIDLAFLLDRCLIAEQRIAKLREMARKLNSFEDYATSRDNMDIAERNIQVAIEACLDIGKIIIANKGLSEPADNKGVFAVLAEAGIITKESLGFLLPMAGTRNIIVHGYDRVDNALIYGILKKHFTNFDDFLDQIRKHAGKSS